MAQRVQRPRSLSALIASAQLKLEATLSIEISAPGRAENLRAFLSTLASIRSHPDFVRRLHSGDSSLETLLSSEQPARDELSQLESLTDSADYRDARHESSSSHFIPLSQQHQHSLNANPKSTKPPESLKQKQKPPHKPPDLDHRQPAAELSFDAQMQSSRFNLSLRDLAKRVEGLEHRMSNSDNQMHSVANAAAERACSHLEKRLNRIGDKHMDGNPEPVRLTTVQTAEEAVARLRSKLHGEDQQRTFTPLVEQDAEEEARVDAHVGESNATVPAPSATDSLAIPSAVIAGSGASESAAQAENEGSKGGMAPRSGAYEERCAESTHHTVEALGQESRPVFRQAHRRNEYDFPEIDHDGRGSTHGSRSEPRRASDAAKEELDRLRTGLERTADRCAALEEKQHTAQEGVSSVRAEIDELRNRLNNDVNDQGLGGSEWQSNVLDSLMHVSALSREMERQVRSESERTDALVRRVDELERERAGNSTDTVKAELGVLWNQVEQRVTHDELDALRARLREGDGMPDNKQRNRYDGRKKKKKKRVVAAIKQLSERLRQLEESAGTSQEHKARGQWDGMNSGVRRKVESAERYAKASVADANAVPGKLVGVVQRE
jgi:predicted  nucleic acid-binding Zn-ribbon protein